MFTITRLYACMFIVLVISFFNVNCEQYKCREPIRQGNISCTISNYTSENFINFKLDSNYHHRYILNLTFTNSVFHQLPSKLFEDFGNVTKLDLRYSQISEIPKETFHSANNLKILILSHNNLLELYDHEFSAAKQLIYIDLGYNKIENIDGQPFKGLNIVKIDLSNNQIKTLPNNIFLSIVVNELNFDFNQIRNSSDINYPNNGSISLNNNKLESLHFDNNLGSIVHADNNGLKSAGVTTGDTGNLIELSLRKNSLTNLNFIRNMTRLTYLDLSYNPLQYNKTEDSDIFNKLTNLRTLNLKSINSNNFDFAMLNILPDSLQTLNISSNNLSSIDFNSFSMTNLTQLDINDNHLGGQTLVEFKYLFPNLNKIDISENDWQCEDLKEALTLLKQLNIGVVNDVRVRNESNIRGIGCSENLLQQPWTTQAPEIMRENSVNMHLEFQTLEKELKKDLYDNINNTIQNITRENSVNMHLEFQTLEKELKKELFDNINKTIQNITRENSVNMHLEFQTLEKELKKDLYDKINKTIQNITRENSVNMHLEFQTLLKELKKELFDNINNTTQNSSDIPWFNIMTGMALLIIILFCIYDHFIKKKLPTNPERNVTYNVAEETATVDDQVQNSLLRNEE